MEGVIGMMAVAVTVGLFVAVVVGGLMARYLATRMGEALLRAKREELETLNTQIKAARSEHGLVQDQIVTLAAIRLTPAIVSGLDREARVILLSSRQCLLRQAQQALEIHAASRTEALKAAAKQSRSDQREHYEELTAHYQSLMDAEAERVKNLAADAQTAADSLKSPAA